MAVRLGKRQRRGVRQTLSREPRSRKRALPTPRRVLVATDGSTAAAAAIRFASAMKH